MSSKYKYLTWAVVVLLVLTFLKILPGTSSVIEAFELKSYDFRQSVSSEKHIVNDDVVVLAIDDASIDILNEKYGQWPWQRNSYVDIINFLEESKAKAIVFDLMFLPNASNTKYDQLLSDTISKYDNVFIAMNFDNRDNEVRLPQSIKAKMNMEKKLDLLSFSGCRPVLPQLLSGTPNIGIINVQRDSDGVLRRAPLFVKYNDDVYPSLAMKVFSFVNGVDEYSVDKDYVLTAGDKKIKLEKDGAVHLNWYKLRDDISGSFKHIPAWRVVKSLEAKKNNSKSFIPEDNFENKIVFVGVTATSQYDIKTTPISKNTAGIEFQTTTFLNLMENNIIHRTSFFINVLISLVLVLAVGFLILYFDSAIVSVVLSSVVILSFFATSVMLYVHQNIWTDIFFPVFAVVIIMIFMYLVKYMTKARDFDYTYKLATTDGLTGLYNHRYMQEQIAKNIASSRRYNTKFSLLLLDIDFFKKFNDTYGHQAGDAVLRYVSELLKKSIRSTDIAARYGGEELVIILTNTDKEEAYITAEKICKKIAAKKMRISEKQEVSVTVSIGVTTYPENGSNSEELIEYADKGLYYAKEHGRNQVGKIPDDSSVQ